jgi:hypothetical protein
MSMRLRDRSVRGALAVLCAIQLSGITIVGQPAPAPYVPPDLIAAEGRQLGSAATEMASYLRQIEALDKQTSIAPSDLVAVQASADRIKRSLGATQTAVRAAIGKLKAAGKWTPELDAYVVSQFKSAGVDPRVGQFIQSAGGYRALADRALADGGKIGAELDASIAELRSKSVARMLLEELTGRRVQCLHVGYSCQLYLFLISSSETLAAITAAGTVTGVPQTAIALCFLIAPR